MKKKNEILTSEICTKKKKIHLFLNGEKNQQMNKRNPLLYTAHA